MAYVVTVSEYLVMGMSRQHCAVMTEQADALAGVTGEPVVLAG